MELSGFKHKYPIITPEKNNPGRGVYILATTDFSRKDITGYNIENISNIYFHKEMKEIKKKNLSPFRPNEYGINFKDKSIVFKEFIEVFTRKEIGILIAPGLHTPRKYSGITVSFVCDSASKTLEVRYSLDINFPTQLSISPDKLHQLELLLKERVEFEPGSSHNGSFKFAKGMFINVDFKKIRAMYPD